MLGDVASTLVLAHIKNGMQDIVMLKSLRSEIQQGQRGKKEMKKTLAMLVCALLVLLSAMAAQQDEGWYVAEYDILWGGPNGESLYMPAEHPGCSMLYTDHVRWEKEGGDGYGDLWIENPSDGEPCYIYRDNVLVATNYTVITGWNEYTDYDVVPGRTYTYEIKSMGATTGPANITCNYIYKADIGTNEVVFAADEDETYVYVFIYNQTATVTNLVSFYDSWFLVSSSDESWIYTFRNDDYDRRRHSCCIRVDANDTGLPREAIVTIDFKGFKWPIKVKQAAKSDNVTVNTEESGEVTIPKIWFADECPTILWENGNDYTLTALARAANRYKVWECYVAGISPTNESARFTAKIKLKDGKPIVTWEPDLDIARTYKVYGSETLEDGGAWQYPTNSLHRFFKVKVEMP